MSVSTERIGCLWVGTMDLPQRNALLLLLLLLLLLGLVLVPVGCGESSGPAAQNDAVGSGVWPAGATLTASAGDVDASLSWTPAGVEDAAYRLFQDGRQIGEATSETFLAESLSPETSYVFKVEVRSAGALWTTDGPSATVTTLEAGMTRPVTGEIPEFPTWDDVKPVLDAYCNQCHSSPSAEDAPSNMRLDICEDAGVIKGARDQAPRIRARMLQATPSVMPPMTAARQPSPDDKELVRRWIDQGAACLDIPVENPADVYDPGFRRLTQEQYNRSLADLHGAVWQSKCEQFDCSWPRDAEAWYQIFVTQNYGYWLDYQVAYPSDRNTGEAGEPRGGYRRLDTNVYDAHLAVWFGSSLQVGRDYENWVGHRIVFTPCENDNDNGVTSYGSQAEVIEKCMENFVTDFGSRAFRRPLAEEEHADFMDVFRQTSTAYPSESLDERETAARGLRNVIAVITSSPEFLYRIEVGDEDGVLTPYELASRLSYHFWNTMPDDALFAAAADGRLAIDEGYREQVERLASDPKASRVIEEFYSDFFRIQDLPDINSQEGPDSYHGGPGYSQYGNTLGYVRAAMQDELTNLGRWFTHTRPGTYEDMFRSNLHFLECQYPAWTPESCYGAGPYSEWSYGFPALCSAESCTSGGWDGVSEPVSLPETQRVGLLTRLGVLGHDTVLARPIRRGLYIREALLCEDVPPPENCDVVKPPEVDVTMTVRQKVEAITEVPGTSCANCHGERINGFGHALGHFSSRGQYWEKEHMFTDQTDAMGNYWYFLEDPENWAEVDTAATSYFDGETHAFDGAHELADLLVESGRLEACWAREYFRFALGRIEFEEDRAAIDGLASTMHGGATLAAAFREIAYTAQFKTLDKPSMAAGEGP
jgi:hypothetical protein